MKKIVWGALATVSGLVLLFSYRTSLGGSVAVDSVSSGGQTTTGTTSSGTSGAGDSSSGSSTSGSGMKDGTFTGQTADTRWGPVQVKITVNGGRITAVDIPRFPDGNGRDAEINQQALPQLVSETLSAQSAHIDMVSGATYTSDGYLQSLQSAIDEASQ